MLGEHITPSPPMDDNSLNQLADSKDDCIGNNN